MTPLRHPCHAHPPNLWALAARPGAPLSVSLSVISGSSPLRPSVPAPPFPAPSCLCGLRFAIRYSKLTVAANPAHSPRPHAHFPRTSVTMNPRIAPWSLCASVPRCLGASGPPCLCASAGHGRAAGRARGVALPNVSITKALNRGVSRHEHVDHLQSKRGVPLTEPARPWPYGGFHPPPQSLRRAEPALRRLRRSRRAGRADATRPREDAGRYGRPLGPFVPSCLRAFVPIPTRGCSSCGKCP